MRQSFLHNVRTRLWSCFVIAAFAILILFQALCAHGQSDTTGEPVITSIVPRSVTVSAAPRIVLALITGEDTGFRFRVSHVSFSSESVQELFTLPVSPRRLWSLLLIEGSSPTGTCDVTVTTGDEVAVGVGLFELKEPGEEPEKRWTGDERLTVRKEGTEGAEVSLRGMLISEYDGRDCIRLSDIVEKSAVTTTPKEYYYNFIAADGFSVKARLILRGVKSGLPPWEDMQRGYLYDAGTDGLCLLWEPDTVAVNAGYGLYKVRLMQGGFIELLDYNVQ
jgi:hypothetical protein